MRTSISQYGILTIEATTPLEAYAIQKWAEDNYVYVSVTNGSTSGSRVSHYLSEHLIIDSSMEVKE